MLSNSSARCRFLTWFSGKVLANRRFERPHNRLKKTPKHLFQFRLKQINSSQNPYFHYPNKIIILYNKIVSFRVSVQFARLIKLFITNNKIAIIFFKYFLIVFVNIYIFVRRFCPKRKSLFLYQISIYLFKLLFLYHR